MKNLLLTTICLSIFCFFTTTNTFGQVQQFVEHKAIITDKNAENSGPPTPSTANFRGLMFGGENQGETIYSKKYSGTTQHGLMFTTNFQRRLNILNDGTVLITGNPWASDAKFNVVNEPQTNTTQKSITGYFHTNTNCLKPNKTGIHNWMTGNSTCNGIIKGIVNKIESTCGNEKTGFYQTVTPNTVYGNVTGIYNYINNTGFGYRTGMFTHLKVHSSNYRTIFGNKVVVEDQYNGSPTAWWRYASFSDIHSPRGTAVYGRNLNNSGWAATFYGRGYLSSGLWTTSDAKLKKEVKPLENALDKVLALNSKTYKFKTKENEKLGLPEETQIGFLAQELEKVFPDLVSEMEVTLNVDELGDNDKDVKPITKKHKIVQYTPLIAVLTSAIQEQHTIIVEQEEKIEDQATQIEDLESRLEKIEALLTNNTTSNIERNSTIENSTNGFTLATNRPNPFTSTTTIDFELPEQLNTASLSIFSINGKQLKSIPLTSQKGSVEINASAFESGMYVYAIVVDGKTIVSKKMSIIK